MMAATENARKTDEHPKFVVIALTEPLKLGQKIDRRNWPLHVTLLSWVMTKDYPKFNAAVKSLAESTQAFQVEVGDREFFGEGKNVPVDIVVPKQELTNLHQKLVDISNELGEIIDRKYIGDNYRAHITEYGGRSIEKNKVMVDNLAVIELLDNNTCRIIEKYDLKKAT